jgi:(p)ppGpp synthase/HD superfamily hydrolase
MQQWITGLRAAEPYINHLLEVAGLVSQATDGSDPELVVAPLLHEAIEDQQSLTS